jgi:hypothetical protein
MIVLAVVLWVVGAWLIRLGMAERRTSKARGEYDFNSRNIMLRSVALGVGAVVIGLRVLL